MNLFKLFVVLAALTACKPDQCVAVVEVQPQAEATPAGGTATLELSNETTAATTVFVAFGADSAVLPAAWPTCVGSGLVCKLPLAAGAKLPLPLAGKYCNATLSFGNPVGCGSSKAEVNLNNPTWYDTADVSLVDGWNANLAIQFGQELLGPTQGAAGNEKAVGVFPLGCDVCVARFQPPCGIQPSPTPGSAGCKKGVDQYHPDVPCQVQGLVKGGGAKTVIRLVP
jgi:hypothetical protein